MSQMFERLQKPFLTVETGEAYQPIRLTYNVLNEEGLLRALDKLECIRKNPTANSWTWIWGGECDALRFESVEGFRRNRDHSLRLGTFQLREHKLYLNLPSFKRACLAVSFFHRVINPEFSCISVADFINKVFGVDERLPHGFTELFKEDELDKILNQRVDDYHKVKEECEHAATAEEAFKILSDYTQNEAKKRLPYAERYSFETHGQDAEVVFLSFYIFLRSRELVAIKRWYGETGYTLSDAADDTIEQVFGEMGIDLIE